MSLPERPLDALFLEFQVALAGRYSIDRELGRGGMGVVYLAREVDLDRLVAIKLLPPDRARDPVLRERFLQEARNAAKLSHPNVIPIHAVDDSHGFVYYVMAFIDGESLAQRVRTRGPLPSTEAARVIREAAWGLSHAHANGLVHRDVKPDNILLETATGRVLVADFGIAAAEATAASGVTGTPEFMSPEQALGKPADARSDIYSLGVTAFLALSARLPFDGATTTEVLAKQVTEPAPPVASMGIPVPRKIAALVDRCLTKEPAQRPASADEIAEQLGLALEQRRELPAALRAFVKRSARLDGPGTMAGAFGVLGASVATSYLFGGRAGVGAFVILSAAAPFAYMLRAASRLMKLGFAAADVEPAFAVAIEQSREERAAEEINPRAQRMVTSAGMAKASGVVVIGSAVLTVGRILLEPRAFGIVGLIGGFGMAVGVPLMLASLAVLGSQRDVDTEFWAKLWTGRIGRLAFATAKRLVGRNVRETAVTHRATELSLGLAVDQLFESLPRATRESLGDLPGLVQRLQRDAQMLRRVYDDLQEAVASSTAASASEALASVRAERDVVHAKLSQAVAALENIRLNLLRLHAGSGTVEGLTTHIGLAADVSAEVDRLIAARAEVARVLAPRTTTPASSG